MSHYYTRQGRPVFQVVGNNGELRDTRITDARKMGLLPSATTILNIIDKAGLYTWICNNRLKLAYECQPIADESFDEWKKAIGERADKEQASTPEFGTIIHNELEMAIENGMEVEENNPVTTPAGEARCVCDFVDPVLALFKENKWDVHDTEKILVGMGYAGTADIVYTGPDSYGIIDFKTTKNAKTKRPQLEHKLQIAMYHVAEFGEIGDKSTGHNIFISTEEEIGVVKVVSYNATELRKAWKAAQAAISLWQYSNNYYPHD